ncbi:TadE/TadG family type IV pilus assembly protein [Aquamicrobium zhengzhouense]|uniref:TadE/TadG family type IV pilus assembly protein n=1 Tax=Aquamicrobium zhengzhouense TaxID=2781738 RepID=UPI001F17FCD8|nr:TadE/TadG family type IV pilus assembly protein [Aquamicrobium zhengzhouense]
MNRPFAWLRSQLRSLAHNQRGVAAVEFALIAPILFVLYFLSMEVSQAIETNKKVSRISSMVADLVTQGSMSATTLDEIMDIGKAIVYPYNRTVPSIEIIGIEVTNENKPRARVAWSRKSVNNKTSAGTTKGTEVSIPESLKVKGTFLVQVKASLDYRPVITWAADAKASLGLVGAFDRIQMGESYYLRPRTTSTITCNNC